MQFKTKARAVDLLGKGQIADLPTAISELWKNGYDAYADTLGAELYTEGYEDVSNPFFVLSDNGKGMSRDDLINKWLVLGTDSKSRGDLPKKGPDTLWKEPRPLMGEKGIGRLSVSYLGSPMLMLTKKIGHPLQAIYFDWRTLENYNLFLDDVNIPIKAIPDLISFKSVFEDLKNDFLSNFNDEDEKIDLKKKAYWSEQQDELKEILESTAAVDLPVFFEEEIVTSLIGDGNEICGTKFIIFKPNDQFLILKKWSGQLNNSDDQDLETVEDIRSGLVGFYNEFKYDIVDSPVKTFFHINDSTGKRDFIGNNAFFSESDFAGCDHLITGKFDIFGSFTGQIRIYKETVSDFFFRPNRPEDKKTTYGPLSLKLGYVPGKSSSMLDDAQFLYYDTKLQTSGGLYIYRDDLRVLPYGRPHSDFLGFEERRTKNAGTAFFSYRRMFGYIELSRETNRPLQDKAGREGFINNAAFRDFKIDLKALFADLARQFFSTNATADYKQKQLDELHEAKANEAQEKAKEKEERTIFKDVVKNTPLRLKSVKDRYLTAKDALSKKISEAKVAYQDIQYLLREIDNLKTEFDKLKPVKPKRFSLNSREKEAFEELLERYEKDALIVDLAQELTEAALRKIEEGQLLTEYENKFSQYANFLDEITSESKSQLRTAFTKINAEFETTQAQYSSQLRDLYNKNLPSPPTREALENALRLLDIGFADLRGSYEGLLKSKTDHLLGLSFDVDDDALVGHYKLQYEESNQQLTEFKSLAQLGIAVEIINHELNSMYSQLNTTISGFDRFLINSSEAQRQYKYLKNAFEHLDSKYKSLNPLYRKSRRTKQYVKGSEITKYLQTFFEDAFKDDNVKLKTTAAFEKSETYTFESVLLPVFINVINNAVYWLRSVNVREILLDFIETDNTIIIANSGPAIKSSQLQEIFELFYTRRPKGRGIGLYLAKDILKTVGLDIEATNDPRYNLLNGASFIIKPNS